MGIESDQLVYEYLSRVGDLAQQRQLSSGDRMRLVSGLRDEIDRRRARYEPETPAAVRGILQRLGTPEEVLAGHGVTGAGSAPVTPAPAVPAQRGPRGPKPAAEPRNVPPHLAGLDELGPSGGAEPDWWRVSPGGFGAGPQVEGFAGGIEFPDHLAKEEEAAQEPEPPAGPPESRVRGLVRFLRERRRAKKDAKKEAAEAEPEAAAAAARPRPNAFLLLAAAVLVVGMVTGYWLLLVVGWLLPYASRVLRPTERKWAVFGPPGVVLAGAMVWLWGRMKGKWGETLAEDQLSGALHGMWPWLLRAAALASVVYLVWRARRR
ncbi:MULTISPECIES: hypothetical protein [unclassified Streptomyces]|uniref:hypothetical protein n=1 Tax=unclassified Streptomyces TaxID=2593676 RepID=UPI00225170F1|nr:hypothetical protein [Streptomyces sp. NBC_00047]MCX5606509.1 hypothetical protein [Streptomyces sp. NBC_00047]